MDKLNKFFDGKKTYIVVILTFAYAIGGYFTGHLGLQEAIVVLFGGSFGLTFRSAIQSLINKLDSNKKITELG